MSIKTLKITKSSSHIVRYLVKAFISIGKKSHSKDRNITRCILAKSIVSKSTRQHCLIKCTLGIVNLNPKTLKKYSITRDSLDIEGQMEK